MESLDLADDDTVYYGYTSKLFHLEDDCHRVKSRTRCGRPHKYIQAKLKGLKCCPRCRKNAA